MMQLVEYQSFDTAVTNEITVKDVAAALVQLSNSGTSRGSQQSNKGSFMQLQPNRIKNRPESPTPLRELGTMVPTAMSTEADIPELDCGVQLVVLTLPRKLGPTR
jgi:hypothetical protein